MVTQNDTGNGIKMATSRWEFNGQVAAEFDQHVQQSVPYYTETQKLAIDMSDWFIRPGCSVLDIGCATGTTLADLVMRHLNKPDVNFIGLDESEAMIAKARERLNGYRKVTLQQRDIMDADMPDNLAMVYCLYTLQFIDPQRRQGLIDHIFDQMNCRGAMVLVEKVLDADPAVTDIFMNLHWSKKEEMGFNVNEIYGKAQALRGVLVPFTLDENIEMLHRAGFSRVSVFFKWCNFAGIIAIK